MGRVEVLGFTLPDGRETTISLDVPEEAKRDGVLRVALNVFRPVEPGRRGLSAPVSGRRSGCARWAWSDGLLHSLVAFVS